MAFEAAGDRDAAGHPHLDAMAGRRHGALPSGKVILAGFTGVTDAELAFAKSNG